MTIQLNSKKLLTALNLCNKAINQNGIVPATSCFQFTALGGKLDIAACNGEVSMETSIDCEGNASVLIPAEKIIKLLSSLPDQPVKIDIGEDFEITVTYNGGVVSFSGYSGVGFLVIKTDKGNEAIVQSEDLQSAIYSTAYARGTDQIQATFNGLNIDLFTDKMVIAGCNLLILSVYNVPGKFKPGKLLLPVSVTNIIGSITIPGDVKVNYSKNSICLEYPGLTVRSLLMGEVFPDYKTIVPKNEIKISVNRVQLLASIKRVLDFSNKVSKQITLNADGINLLVSGIDTSLKQKGNEQITLVDKGLIEISVNGQFLSDALAHMGSEIVEILWQASNIAILLNEPGETENFVMIMAIVNT